MRAIILRQFTAVHPADLNRCDNAFTVDAELRLHAENKPGAN